MNRPTYPKASVSNGPQEILKTPRTANGTSSASEGNGASGAARTPEVQLGYVTYDGRTRSNATCGVVVAAERAKHFSREVYVGVRDQDQGIEFLGRIIAGPFYTPRGQQDEVSAPATDDAASNPRQRYHVYGTVELLGELAEDDRLVPTATRPRPFSEVFIFPDHRLTHFLGLEGDFYLGHLTGHARVKVHAKSQNKNFLPRNVGIFGTVGSGKSNTAQVMAEEAIAAGWAVLLIDVEGEYVRMNEPNDDPVMNRRLAQAYHYQPKGIKDYRVFVPSSGRSAAAFPIPFKVPISALYPEVVADILEFTEAETRVYGMVTAQAARVNATGDEDPNHPKRPYDLQQLIDGLMESPSMSGPANVRLLPMANEHDVSTASLLRSKLTHLGRSDMLDWRDTAGVAELPIQELLVGGRLSVLDVSETDDRSRNIAITYVLQELFKYVTATPVGQKLPAGHARPPLLVVIEEVHTFISRAAAPKMRAVLDSLQTISRRGRKRWMALALVSQQPNHVPDEVFELTNTRIVHQVKSPVNLDPIKRTTAGVDDTLWETIATMGPGQCLLTSSIFKKPLLLSIRPARSCRLHAV